MSAWLGNTLIPGETLLVGKDRVAYQKTGELNGVFDGRKIRREAVLDCDVMESLIDDPATRIDVGLACEKVDRSLSCKALL